LTDHLVDLAEAKWLKTIKTLRNVKLIAPESKHNKDTLDCHPLVREHFGERLQQLYPQAWRNAIPACTTTTKISLKSTYPTP